MKSKLENDPCLPVAGSYDVAAYVWPSYTGDEPRTRMFWPEGNGEWETVRKAVPKYPGHPWPRRPLWGGRGTRKMYHSAFGKCTTLEA